MQLKNNLVLKIVATVGLAVFGIVDAVVTEKQINRLCELKQQSKEESD